LQSILVERGSFQLRSGSVSADAQDHGDCGRRAVEQDWQESKHNASEGRAAEQSGVEHDYGCGECPGCRGG